MMGRQRWCSAFGERIRRSDGAWALVSISLKREATLTNQERGKDWEYRVIAINKAGESAPSNTVTAVV
ncbi:MAG: fibronectin type III domain-containing protein [Candidatus Hydrogenedentes bacterium]|nr:fibronectin type III domain-containing protein [Candidatus Hydrogenedentota bacterium]